MRRRRSAAKMGEKSEIWVIADVAKYFGVSVRTIHRLYQGEGMKPGSRDFTRLPRYRIGSAWRWFRDEVKEFAKRGTVA